MFSFLSCITSQDRVYTKNVNVPEIWDAGMILFLKQIFRPPIQQHLVTAVLKEIRLERDGYTISRSTVKGCVDVMLQLDDDSGESVYKRDLEPALLRESEAFYKAEGERLMESCDAPEYLRRVSLIHTPSSITTLILIDISGRRPFYSGRVARAALSIHANRPATPAYPRIHSTHPAPPRADRQPAFRARYHDRHG